MAGLHINVSTAHPSLPPSTPPPSLTPSPPGCCAIQWSAMSYSHICWSRGEHSAVWLKVVESRKVCSSRLELLWIKQVAFATPTTLGGVVKNMITTFL